MNPPTHPDGSAGPQWRRPIRMARRPACVVRWGVHGGKARLDLTIDNHG